MTNDPGDAEEKLDSFGDSDDKSDSFEFDDTGEVAGYISQDQARVLAMRTAQETPGAYGRRLRRTPIAFEVASEEDTEDHYVVTLSFRSQGDFEGTPGQEQFFIEKEGAVAVRQVLSLPQSTGLWRFPSKPVIAGFFALGVVGVVIAGITLGTIISNPSNNPVSPTPTNTVSNSAAPTPSAAAIQSTPIPTPGATQSPGGSPTDTPVASSQTPASTPLAQNADFINYTEGQTLFEDDFEGGIAEEWKITASDFVVEQDRDGQTVGYSKGDFAEGGIYIDNIALEDFALEFRSRIRATAPDQRLTVQFLRNVPWDETFEVHLNTDNSNTNDSIGADIFNETNQSGRNVSSKIASDQTLMLELDRWYAIRVEILGPNIVVNLDGETILSATAESPIEAKRVGLESRKGLSYYIDDVRVVELLLEADGLVAYWPADGNADDVVGGNHGTLRDGASFGDGVVGQAFSFDGVDDYVEIPATANLTQEGTTSLTVAAWIKIEEPCHGVINGRPHWVLHWQGCGRSLPVRLGFHIGAEGGWSQVDSDTAVDGEWHHWVGVYDGSSQKLYLDGALDISVVHTGPIIGTGDGNPDWLTIGKDYHPVSMGNSYAEEGRYNSGLIDEVRIYDRALTADEIKTLYDEVNPMMEASSATIPSSEGLIAYWPADGNANDVAGGNHGTLQAGASFADGIVGQAFSFDGIGEYVRVPDVPSLQLTADTPSTLSGWIFPVDMPPDRFVAVPIEKDYYFELLYQTGNNALRAHVHNGTHWIYIDTPYDLQLNRWTHLAQTWDGETLRVYADGVLLGAGATLGVSYQPVPDDASLDIGKHIETTFSGLIDEVRIYDRALSDEEIKAMYDSVSQ